MKIATIKIGREKLERCKEWLAQQKREKGKIQSQPIDDLESDASADEDELCLLRLNEAAQVSARMTPIQNKRKNQLYRAVFMFSTASRASECEKDQNLFRMWMAEVQRNGR